MLQLIPLWVHVGMLLRWFQPLLSLLALLHSTSILITLFSSLIPFSSLSLSLWLLLSSPFFASFSVSGGDV